MWRRGREPPRCESGATPPGMANGLAFSPAVPGLAPRGFYGGGSRGGVAAGREPPRCESGAAPHGMANGVAISPAVPGLAPRGFYRAV